VSAICLRSVPTGAGCRPKENITVVLAASSGQGDTSGLILFVAAGVAVILVGAVFARIDRSWRSSKYRRTGRHRPGAEVVASLPSSSALAAMLREAQAPTWFVSCQNDVNVEHDVAVRLQKRYDGLVARCIAVLGIGAIITCVSAIALRDNAGLNDFAAQYDVMATLYALACFVAARFANRAFVRQRAFVELLRAWTHLLLIFPLQGSDSVEAAYWTEKAKLASRIKDRDRKRAGGEARADPAENRADSRIYRGVERCWMEMQATCRSLDLRPVLPVVQVGFYIKERPLEQLAYFAKAQDRIHDGQRQREALMFGLYGASVVLASVKALVVFGSALPAALAKAGEVASLVPVDWMSTGLLGLMAVSAALTNALVSRNERSLLHSYHAQERRIRRWFEMIAVTLSKDRPVPSAHSILAFENVMLEELLDFIHITSRDVIEVPG
jgi:hypothetical protein